jgi:hypothetical protein
VVLHGVWVIICLRVAVASFVRPPQITSHVPECLALASCVVVKLALQACFGFCRHGQAFTGQLHDLADSVLNVYNFPVIGSCALAAFVGLLLILYTISARNLLMWGAIGRMIGATQQQINLFELSSLTTQCYGLTLSNYAVCSCGQVVQESVLEASLVSCHVDHCLRLYLLSHQQNQCAFIVSMCPSQVNFATVVELRRCPADAPSSVAVHSCLSVALTICTLLYKL